MDVLEHGNRVEDHVFDAGKEDALQPGWPGQTRLQRGVETGQSKRVDCVNRAANGSRLCRFLDEWTTQDQQVVHVSAGQPEIGFQHSDKRRTGGKSGDHHAFRIESARLPTEAVQPSAPLPTPTRIDRSPPRNDVDGIPPKHWNGTALML